MSGEIIKSARKARGVTLEKMAELTGISVSTLSRIENEIEGRNLRVDHVNAIAEALNMNPADLLMPIMIPIVGKAGAGPDGTVLFATGDGNFGEMPLPEGLVPETVALEVEGDSMTGIADDGWLITYSDKVAPTEEHMGQPCVVWLEDDRVLVKKPYPGRGQGLYDLESTNKPTMRDVPVRAMALITDIKPRAAARKWLKRNGDAQFTDVKIPA